MANVQTQARPAATAESGSLAGLWTHFATGSWGLKIGTGIVLLIVNPGDDSAPSGEAAASLGVRVGPTGAALVGTF